jgi:hypothetical protein
LKKALIAIAAAAMLAGCGGSGGGGGLASSSRVSLFITDSMDGNDHVWVTVKSVDLLTATGSTNVFSDPAGATVDLKTLRDSTGERFKFLNDDSIPAGTYTGARVTLDNNLVVFPHLATTGTAMTFDPVYDDGSGNSAMSFNFSSPKTISAGSEDDIVVDFDLANWNETGGVVTVSLKEGSENGLHDHDRHEKNHHEGSVAGLTGTAPDFTFTLTHGDHDSFMVTTDANTRIFAGDGAAPGLANGLKVKVEGIWDETTSRLLATSIRVKGDGDGDHENTNELEGSITEFSLDSGFIRVATKDAEGFMPTNDTVRIEFTDTTKFLGHEEGTLTKEEFFALLSNGVELGAKGTYNASTGVLTAEFVRLEEDHSDDHGGDTGGSTGGDSTP